ncbi:MAG: hypothetical protein KatS3mg106_531 [Gemmataceae bacterium]|jgi:hypothetical protein|nr:MAG: hypothetical protein KatS3mg106_531 [Gemmataceae bacterium]
MTASHVHCFDTNGYAIFKAVDNGKFERQACSTAQLYFWRLSPLKVGGDVPDTPLPRGRNSMRSDAGCPRQASPGGVVAAEAEQPGTDLQVDGFYRPAGWFASYPMFLSSSTRTARSTELS